MGWTYSATLATTRDRVRFLVRDVDSTKPLVADEEITWALTQYTNIYRAAALVCDALGAPQGPVVSKRVGDLSITYDPKIYRDRARQLRWEAATRTALPYAGGISETEKDSYEDDTDRVNPAFTRNMLSNRGIDPDADWDEEQ